MSSSGSACCAAGYNRSSSMIVCVVSSSHARCASEFFHGAVIGLGHAHSGASLDDGRKVDAGDSLRKALRALREREMFSLELGQFRQDRRHRGATARGGQRAARGATRPNSCIPCCWKYKSNAR
ncbi:hypothetical protein OKW30_000683 [Paraburkholderia sp. Clong3]|uniref:hypothetical protein n=1 Tax=Paraburkholderia sp. Clong3 TaxID=2991061 RepID=UPI003D1D182A